MISLRHQLCPAAQENGAHGSLVFREQREWSIPSGRTSRLPRDPPQIGSADNEHGLSLEEKLFPGWEDTCLGQTVHNKVSVAHIHGSWGSQHEEHFIPFMLIFSICSLLPARYSHVESSLSLPFPSLFQKSCQARAFYH